MAAHFAQEGQAEMKQSQLLSMSKNCQRQAEARRLLSAAGNVKTDASLEGNEVHVLTRGQMHATR